MVASTTISIAFNARNTTTTHGGRRAIERQGRLREWCQCSQVGSKLGGPAAKSAFVAKLATAAARVVIARAFLVRVPASDSTKPGGDLHAPYTKGCAG
jgi:hypothetical protein